MKYNLLLILVLFSFSQMSCQLVIQQGGSYDMNEIDILLNNYNVNTPYQRDIFLSKVGNNPTEYKSSNSEILKEYDYNIYMYLYGASRVIVNDEWGVSDVQINDNRLSINGITVGDSIDKAKNAFAKKTNENGRLVIWYAGSELSFYYNSSNKITRITFIVPT
ncbi:MAG: hypothetical protein WBN56_15355 [Robiginitalea sp.]|uniref:hypothetical protein n=1 Tax=Robiginitalea sp. TaxID=1902411 RepID=UPI003C73D0E5